MKVQYLFQKKLPTLATMNPMPAKIENQKPAAIEVIAMSILTTPQSRNVLKAPTAPYLATWRITGIFLEIIAENQRPKLAKAVKKIIKSRILVALMGRNFRSIFCKIGIEKSAKDMPIKEISA